MGSRHTCAPWIGVCIVLCALPVLGAPALSNACIASDVQQAFASCPAGPGKKSLAARRATTIRTLPPAREKRSSGPAEPAGPPPIERPHVLKPRVTALLLREIAGLERLLKSTPKKSADRPTLIRRLAEGYVELEASARSAKATVASKKTIALARKGAIRHYRAFVAAYPNHPKIDEVLYYLAHEHELSGDHASARTVYYDLIRRAPTSPYVPRAYLAFGELFFQEAPGDPSKWELAAQAYREVIKYPAPDNKLHGFARYKLAYVHWNREELPEALGELKKAIEVGQSFPSLPGATALAASARRDAVSVYAASGAPDRAYAFFAPLSGDRSGASEKTLALLDRLGIAYLDIGRYREAIALYRDLGRRDPGARDCHYQTQIAVATQALESGDKPAVVRELSRLLALRDGFVKGSAPAASKQSCSNRTAELLAETAMMWHLEAVGSGGVRGTNDERTKDHAADLYRKILGSFSAKDFAKLEFSRIVRADWPTLSKIAYSLADLEYSRGRWAECASAFDAVVAANPSGPDAAEAAFAAVACYQKLYEARHPKDSDRVGRDLTEEPARSDWQRLAPKPLEEGQKRMLAAIDRYRCWIEVPKGDRAAQDQRVEVLFARARTYYEAQHWEEAALGFREIALEHPEHDAGIYAAHLYLESLNVLASRARPARSACFREMTGDVAKLARAYCAAPKDDELGEQCALLARVGADLERREIEDMVARADAMAKNGATDQSRELHSLAADRYLAIWKGQCEGPLSRGERPKACERADELLYNAARAYQAAHLLAKSMQARQTLIDPKYGLSERGLALKATYELGGNYQAIAVYDRAADFYQRYVDATCKAKRRCGEHADKALADTVVLFLGLGQSERAIEGAAAFNRWFGTKQPAETARIAFAVAAHFVETGDFAEARRRLAGAMKLIDEKASLDVRLQAHALLGRAEQALGHERRAADELATVLRLWTDPKRAASEIRASGDDGERRLGRALDAVGEAQFFFAERKRSAAQQVRFPVYRGPGDKALVLAHIHGPVAEWVKKKRPRIVNAAREYEKIVALSPAAPPRWVIAAGERVGGMWAGFVEEFRSAPIPDSIKNDPELRNAYYEALDRASEPQKLAARGAYETCLAYSVKYQYADAHSRACELWLAATYKADYHVVDEFRGSPTHRNDPLRERPDPLPLRHVAQKE